jgi:acyl-CoA synthetase (NDP forming)
MSRLVDAFHDSKLADAARALLTPQSVVLVGASDKSRWSTSVYDNLIRHAYKGGLHLVNPRGAIAHGRQCATDCAAVGEQLDLGLIMVPREAVPQALGDLADAGGRSAVILSAGYAELGPAGRAEQDAILDLAKRRGIRLLGPNCLGFINFTQNAIAWTTPVQAPSRAHGVAIVSQSGATAHFLAQLAHQQDVGLSHVISTGNEADLDITSFIDCLIEEPQTRAIAVFAETVREPERFLRVAAKALRAGKPLVVLKVGSSEVTAQSALAHTGALVGNDKVFDGICQQFGILRTYAMEDLLATADIAGRCGVLRGRGVGVVTNSGGVGEIAADTAHRHGLVLPPLNDVALAEMLCTIPSVATAQNPLDLTGTVTPEQCEGAVRAMASVTDCAALLCPWYDIPSEPQQVSERLTALHLHLVRGLREAGVPGFLVSYTPAVVNDMARQTIAEIGANYLACGMDRALAGLAGAVRWSQRYVEESNDTAEPPLCAMPQTSFGKQKPTWQPRSEREALDALASLGVPVVPGRLATTAEQAVTCAQNWNGPVVLKVASADIAHKSDIGGVMLNLLGESAIREAFAQITNAARMHAPEARLDGVLVAPMRLPGTELLVGFSRDSLWGPVMAVGLGGVWVEVLQDVALRPLPVSAQEALRMLKSLRGLPLLQGHRGLTAAHLDVLATVIAQISQAIIALGPNLLELDINPLWVRGDQVEALDALMVWRLNEPAINPPQNKAPADHLL